MELPFCYLIFMMWGHIKWASLASPIKILIWYQTFSHVESIDFIVAKEEDIEAVVEDPTTMKAHFEETKILIGSHEVKLQLYKDATDVLQQ